MPKKQRPAKQQEESSFLTPDFLRKQKLSLEAKLSDYHNLQKLAREGIKITSFDERKGDATEQAFTYSERQNAAWRLEGYGKTIPQVVWALHLINNLLTGKKKGEEYGKCVDCERQIPERRLTAIPWTPCCVLCQEKRDTKG